MSLLPTSESFHVQPDVPPPSSTDGIDAFQCQDISPHSHPRPALCRAQAPQTIHESPTGSNHRMKQHDVIESLLKSSSSKPSLSFSSPEQTSMADDYNEAESLSHNFAGNTPNEKKQSTNSQHPKQRVSSSAASLVVCGVDGTVFTFDAYTGQLRGMFASGPALVFSSDAIRSEEEDVFDHDDQEDGASTASIVSTARPWKERVVPGLDGRLFSLYEQNQQGEYDVDETSTVGNCHQGDGAENDDFLDELCSSQDDSSDESHLHGGKSSTSIMSSMNKYNLQPLPISVMDVVDSPISSCRPVMDADDAFEGVQRQQCGIVVGSKKTTIYAIDPMTGKVRWTQDPHGGGGAKGFTTGRPADARGKPTVLLQREDYAVKHLDTDGGDEVWKVELGRYSALDFDINAHPQNKHSVDDDIMEDPIVVGGRGRAATAAGVTEKQRTNLPPILGGGRKKLGSFRDESEFENHEFEFNYEHTNFRAFPSVAFGEDGTSILAVDSISGELLWKRQIESVVAAVYGVGKTSSWVPLDVIEESDVLTHGHHQGANLLSSSSSKSHTGGGLVPYGSNHELDAHRLGRHRNHLFVSSKSDPLGIDPPLFPESDVIDDRPNYIDEHGDYDNMLLPPKQAPLISQAPYSMPIDVTPPVSHRTEHGLYLTWSMISTILILLFSLIAYARIYYLRQKRKWTNTPTLAPTASNSGSTDHSLTPRGELLPPTSFTDEKRSFPGTPWWKTSADDINKQPPARSLSLGAIARQSENPGKSFIQERSTDLTTAALSPIPNTTSLFRNDPKETKSLAGTATITTTSPTVARSLTVPMDDDQKQDIDNIDGIPLVRYSRYRSEFKEISALGRGGFGTVFKCENALDSREYAIKKIWIKSQMLDGKVTKHFFQKLHRVLREVKILALLDHPNIVRYYTAWLEIDNEGAQLDEEESNMLSSKASPSLFSGFGSTSRGPSLIFKAGGSLFSKSNKGLSSYMPKSNPLGWNNFASFRPDDSKSASKLSNVNENTLSSSVDVSRDDLGFVWERSNEYSFDQSLSNNQTVLPNKTTHNLNEEDGESSPDSSAVSSVDSQEITEEKRDNLNAKLVNFSDGILNTGAEPEEKKEPVFTTERRHVLYIQMQLCSVQTLADFLGNRQARMGCLTESSEEADCYAVDIPFALKLFSQIAHGVRYVHKQGLIHRDLKPQNCFIDDAGNAKVGDFGLSRESSTVGGLSAFDEGEDDTDAKEYSVDTESQEALETSAGKDAENTAGVGTRAYASPEQMKGSNYDASTDIYSLGIILFEMCYPLYTTHERYKEFCGIRKGQYPSYWNSHVKKTFPSLHNILLLMLSPTPSKRPSAADVSDHIDKLLTEYTVQSLDKSWGKKGAILLRVEADEEEGVLTATMKLIKTAAPNAIIQQYGLRGQGSKAIMEFAIEITDDAKGSLDRINTSLRNNNMAVRQIQTSTL